MIAQSDKERLKAAILNMNKTTQELIASAKCKTCLDTKRVQQHNRRQRCPDCDFDPLEKFGFYFSHPDGKTELVTRKNLARLVRTDKLRDPRFLEPKSRLLIGEKAGESKTVYLWYCYNCFLHELKFRERIFFSTEWSIYKTLRAGRFQEIYNRMMNAKVIIWDELGTKQNWALSNGVQAAEIEQNLYILVDSIHERRKTLIAASNYDFGDTIPHPGMVRRFQEMFGKEIIKL